MVTSSISPRALTVFSQKEIKNLFKRSRTVLKESGIQIKKAPKSLSYGRILIVIPKLVGDAVQRNLIRRRIKSIFYEEKLFATGYDFIIFMRTGEAAELSFENLKSLLLKAA